MRYSAGSTVPLNALAAAHFFVHRQNYLAFWLPTALQLETHIPHNFTSCKSHALQ